MQITVDVSEVLAAFAEYRDRILEGMNSGVTEAALEFQKVAKQECPPTGSTSGGRLKESIGIEVQQSGESTTAIVGTQEEYAIYVHEGTGIYARHGDGRKNVPWPYTDDATGEQIWTKGNHPNPFMDRAREQTVGIIPEIIRDAIEQKLGR